jgi:DNA-binding XRE family transcriptional regulator
MAACATSRYLSLQLLLLTVVASCATMHPMSKQSANPLTKYRSAKKLTLEAFGAGLGVNKSTILRWEEKGVPAERVNEVAKITGIPRAKLRPDIFGDAAA